MQNGPSDFSSLSDDVGLGLIVEVAFGDGPWVQRIDDLGQFADARLDRSGLQSTNHQM
jgi:hypothetical protein